MWSALYLWIAEPNQNHTLQQPPKSLQMQIAFKILAILQLSVFFYLIPRILELIWPDEIKNFPTFYVSSLSLGHFIGLLVGNLYFLPFYLFENDYIKQFKTEKGPWPWEVSQAKWKQQLVKILRGVTFNFLLGVLFGLAVSLFTGVRFGKDTFPSLLEFGAQMIFQLVMDDFGFYWSHRLIHQPGFYKYHKQHHEFHVTVAIAAEYAHPVEYILGDLTPVFLGTLILGNKMHMATLGTWICLKTFRAAMFHAGYEFPWSLMSVIPFGGHEEFHSFHHSQNMGNYATWLLVWDRVFGTDKVYYESKKNGSYGRIKSQ